MDSIDRQHFEWIFNPFLEVIKAYLDRNLDKFLKGKEYISKTDLEYQVLIKMCSYKIEELFKGDIALLREINSGINNCCLDHKHDPFLFVLYHLSYLTHINGASY